MYPRVNKMATAAIKEFFVELKLGEKLLRAAGIAHPVDDLCARRKRALPDDLPVDGVAKVLDVHGHGVDPPDCVTAGDPALPMSVEPAPAGTAILEPP